MRGTYTTIQSQQGIKDDHPASPPPTESPTVPVYPEGLTLAEFPTWIARHYSRILYDDDHGTFRGTFEAELDHETLQESLLLGCNNIALNQKEAGNFNYLYDFVTREMDPGDSPVRQAGALWGMTLCLQHEPQRQPWRTVVEKGLDFFLQHTADGPMPGSRMVTYPGYAHSDTGANALLGLALVDYLRTIQDNDLAKSEKHESYQSQLTATVQFLKFLQLPSQSFAQYYDVNTKRKADHGSPYYDGESMLCLVKAARYIEGYDNLIPLIQQSALPLMKRYTLDEFVEDEDSPTTKGFYQWSAMFAAEYYHAKWKDYDVYGDFVIIMAHWVIHGHRILRRNRNTGYAFEGIISGYEIARLRGHYRAYGYFMRTIDIGLHKLTTWQVGGPLADENDFLVEHPTDEAIAIGGVMNAQHESTLRIDTTQHQMHAVMMAMDTLYSDRSDLNYDPEMLNEDEPYDSPNF
jgi:UDP-N-acetylmuramoyl-tripeptide--D-alanyl-D-alanine ligase